MLVDVVDDDFALGLLARAATNRADSGTPAEPQSRVTPIGATHALRVPPRGRLHAGPRTTVPLFPYPSRRTPNLSSYGDRCFGTPDRTWLTQTKVT